MKLAFFLLLMAVSLARGDEDYALLNIPGGNTIRLPLELFRSQAEQSRILTRREQLLQLHTGGTGHTIKHLMTPIRNQGARGTCTAFAAAAILETFTGEDYSEQCLVRMSSDRDPGFVEERLEYVRRNGIYLEKDCPYDSSQRDNIPELNQAERRRFDAEFEIYPFSQLEADPIRYIKSRLVASSPVAVAFYVVGTQQWATGPFLYVPDARTIAMECGFLRSCASHAVVVTGVNDDLRLIEFKNSWGKGWGKEGYGYVSYEYFLTFGKGFLVSY